MSADYRVVCEEAGRASVSGVLRLPSLKAYESALEPVRSGLSNAAAVYTVDVTDLQFINSSGITALSRLVVQARSEDKGLVFRINRSIAWQERTLTLLKRLYAKVEVEVAG